MSNSETVTLPPTVTTSADEHQGAPGSVPCEKIRERAYYKWEAAGCPCGDGVQFWLQAEAELSAGTHPAGEPSET
jgi:hypothetical protein